MSARGELGGLAGGLDVFTHELQNANKALHLDELTGELDHALHVTEIAKELGVPTDVRDLTLSPSEKEEQRQARSAARKKKALGLSQRTRSSRNNVFSDVLKGTCGIAKESLYDVQTVDVLGENLPAQKSDDKAANSKKAALNYKQYQSLVQDLMQAMKSDAEDLWWAIEYAKAKGFSEDDPNITAALVVLEKKGDPVHHPTRVEILANEPPDEITEGEDNSMDDNQKLDVNSTDFMQALNGYILDKDLPRKSQCWADRLWKFIDVNGDNQLSRSEAKDFVRYYLSRPALGVVLGPDVIKKIIEEDSKESEANVPSAEINTSIFDFAFWPATGSASKDVNSAELEKQLQLEEKACDKAIDASCEKIKTLAARAVADSCRGCAKEISTLSKDFWRALDQHQNGIVDGDEFVQWLRYAVETAIEEPVVQRAKKIARVLLKAGAQHAKTPEDSKVAVQKYKAEERRKKEEEEKLKAEEEEKRRKQICVLQ